jgi:hypothetical protein
MQAIEGAFGADIGPIAELCPKWSESFRCKAVVVGRK